MENQDSELSDEEEQGSLSLLEELSDEESLDDVLVEHMFMERVPEEVLARGEEALQVFNKELEKGKITVNHARLMFTGKEGVGKSCLVNSLLGKPFNEDKPSTSGIEVLTTIAFGYNEWKEETKNIDDCERTKQILESTVEGKVAEKLKQTKRQTEALEQTASTSTTEHDVAGTKPKRGQKKKDVSNRIQALPPETLKRIEHRMRGENPQHSNEDITFIWDFAGQQLYYITHRIFLTSEAVYLILFNLREGMHNKGKRRFSKMAKYVMTYDMTNIQIIKYWMRLIYTYAIPVKAQLQLQGKKPQIAVVGTHSDCLEGTEEDKKKQIEEQYGILFQEIRGTPYESHVVRKMYAISNKYASQCEMLETLKQDVGGFLKEMPKTIPLKWLKFQQILQENGRTSLHMTYAKVCKVATECGISVENLIHTLNYLHDLGIILYFENNRLLKHAVITNPRKLIFILKKIITEVEPDDDEKWPLMIEDWNKLEEEGILEEKLARHLWRDEISKDETCFEFFLEIMKQFGLLCEQIKNQESTHRSFFVPCRLKRSTDTMAIKSDSDQMVSIYMASEDFIPDSIFHPLVVSLIGMVQNMGYKAKLELFSNYANIWLGHDHTLSLGPVVIDNKPSLKLEILRMSVVHEDGTTTSTGEPTPRVCMQVLEFLKQEMKVLTIGMKHTGYAFRVLCWQDSKKTHFHNLDECLEKDSIPCGKKLITTVKLQRMFRNKKILTENPSLPEWTGKKWSSRLRNRTQCGNQRLAATKCKKISPSVETAGVGNIETVQPGPSMETADISNTETVQPEWTGKKWSSRLRKRTQCGNQNLAATKSKKICPSMETADVSNTETVQPGPAMDTTDVRNAETAQQDGNLGYVDDKHLYLIAKDLGLAGKQLGVRLGLRWNKIQQIWSDNRRLSISECIVDMLTEWRKQQNYETNQVEIMCRALKEQRLTELANKVFGSQSEVQSSHVRSSRDHEHDGCLADTDFQFIAERLDDDWKDLGIYLNIKRSEIQRIKTDFSPPTVDACMDMLVKWRERQEAKVNHLAKIIDALTNLEREDVIEELKLYYQEKYN